MRHGKFERLEVAKKTVKAKWRMVVTKTDTRAISIGLKRTLLALMTLMTFGIAVFGFIRTASSSGYAAVVLFFASVLVMIVSFIFLYAQGITNKTQEESKGEK
jgi:hypothetical protein